MLQSSSAHAQRVFLNATADPLCSHETLLPVAQHRPGECIILVGPKAQSGLGLCGCLSSQGIQTPVNSQMRKTRLGR